MNLITDHRPFVHPCGMSNCVQNNCVDRFDSRQSARFTVTDWSLFSFLVRQLTQIRKLRVQRKMVVYPKFYFFHVVKL